MMLMTIALTRRSDIACADFIGYWRDRRAPLERELAPILDIRHYVQIHSLSDVAIARTDALRSAVHLLPGDAADRNP